MNKDNLNILKLGATNGFVFGLLLELSLRAIYLYEDYIFNLTPLSNGLHIDRSGYPFSFWFLPLFSLMLVTIASYLVSGLAQRIRSQFLLWQIICFVAVLEACLYSVIMILSYSSFSMFDFLETGYLQHQIQREWLLILRIVPLAIGFNLLFVLGLRYWRKPLL